MFDNSKYAYQNDTKIMIHFFGSLYSINSVTSLEVIEKGYIRAAIMQIFNQYLLVILSKVNGMSLLL